MSQQWLAKLLLGELILTLLFLLLKSQLPFMINKILIVLVCFLIGCKSYESGMGINSISISPDPIVLDVGTFLNKIYTVQLSGTDLPLSVYRVLPYENGYFLLDGNKKSIWTSDNKGNSKKILESIGEGPGEYQEIWDLKINPESNELFILDRKLSKMLLYSKSLNFVKEIPIKREFVSSILSFWFLNGNEILFQTSGTSGYKFLKYEISSNKFDFKVPIGKEFEGLGFGNDKSMSFLNNQISVIYPLSNKIERYDELLNRKEDLFLDFHDFKISEDELNQVANDQNLMFDLIQNDENKKAHSFLLEETDNFYVLSYYLGSFRNGDFLKSVVNKSSGENRTWKSIEIENTEIDVFLIGKSKGDELIFTVNSEELERLSDSQIQKLSKMLKIPIDQNLPLLIFGTQK